MSTFIVEKAHIDYMLTAGMLRHPMSGHTLRWWTQNIRGLAEIAEYRRELTEDTAGQVGAMLLAENQRSVNHRYDEDELEEPYLFARVRGVSSVWALKAIDCYEYQACEHAGWDDSEARRFCVALRDWVIDLLPGYMEAPWGLDSGNVEYHTGMTLTELMKGGLDGG